MADYDAVIVGSGINSLACAAILSHVFGRSLDLPAGTRIVVVGALMALVLILRPEGLTGGRELSLRRARPLRVLTKFAR